MQNTNENTFCNEKTGFSNLFSKEVHKRARNCKGHVGCIEGQQFCDEAELVFFFWSFFFELVEKIKNSHIF
jgi:hypothetical protein